ncbi:MAG: hypothetical protein IIB77_01910 [Proteobacteria bacterium]|nr:hypothetical protein [Pseudomonadota bacterium]
MAGTAEGQVQPWARATLRQVQPLARGKGGAEQPEGAARWIQGGTQYKLMVVAEGRLRSWSPEVRAHRRGGTRAGFGEEGGRRKNGVC